MKIVVDTSSLLSLEFMDILNDAVSIAEVYTTNIVLDELKEIASFKDEKSEIAGRILRLVQDGKIKGIQVKNGSFSKYISRNVDSGEASCLALCISEKIRLLITNDADATYYLGRAAKRNGIEIRICTAVLMELIKSKKISKSDAKNKIEELIKKRGREGGVLEVLAERHLE